jgi:hypothetical protein
LSIVYPPQEVFGWTVLTSDQETKDVVQAWLKRLAATFFGEGIHKLAARYDGCLNLHDDYVQK